MQIEFEWFVPTAGYELIDAHVLASDGRPEKKSQRVLVERAALAGATPWRMYRPLKNEPTLFFSFARGAATESAFLAFADEYGALVQRGSVAGGGVMAIPAAARVSRRGHSPKSISCCPIANFAGLHSLLAPAVDLWDAARLEDVRRINQLLIRRGNRLEFVPTGSTYGRTRFVGQSTEPIEPSSDPLFDARSVVVWLANTMLAENLESRFLLQADRRVGYRLAAKPQSLADALLLQFAMAVGENRQYRSCEVCGKSFEISPETARSNKTLCSDACKVKSYRRRKADALRLGGEGKSPAAVAKAVGSQLATVRKWLGETGAKKRTASSS